MKLLSVVVGIREILKRRATICRLYVPRMLLVVLSSKTRVEDDDDDESACRSRVIFRAVWSLSHITHLTCITAFIRIIYAASTCKCMCIYGRSHIYYTYIAHWVKKMRLDIRFLQVPGTKRKPSVWYIFALIFPYTLSLFVRLYLRPLFSQMGFPHANHSQTHYCTYTLLYTIYSETPSLYRIWYALYLSCSSTFVNCYANKSIHLYQITHLEGKTIAPNAPSPHPYIEDDNGNGIGQSSPQFSSMHPERTTYINYPIYIYIYAFIFHVCAFRTDGFCNSYQVKWTYVFVMYTNDKHPLPTIQHTQNGSGTHWFN